MTKRRTHRQGQTQQQEATQIAFTNDTKWMVVPIRAVPDSVGENASETLWAASLLKGGRVLRS